MNIMNNTKSIANKTAEPCMNTSSETLMENTTVTEPTKLILYRGRLEEESWVREIEDGQLHPTVILAGRTYKRFLVGEEKHRSPDQKACPSCLAARDQFHCVDGDLGDEIPLDNVA